MCVSLLKCSSYQLPYFQFDLLGLPDEIIDLTFSFLDIRDRMRARMNKRLSKIETESKYYLEKVVLRQVWINSSLICSTVNLFSTNN